jgi:hypothetical protein
MTPFVILVVLVSAAYCLYYAYHISKDLYGKPKDNTNTAEVFDMQSLNNEVIATPVKEIDGGFFIGGQNMVTEKPTPQEQSHPDASGKFDAVKESLEEANVLSEGEMMDAKMYEWMTQHNVTKNFAQSTIKEIREVL